LTTELFGCNNIDLLMTFYGQKNLDNPEDFSYEYIDKFFEVLHDSREMDAIISGYFMRIVGCL